jgi:hypothetical protein
MTLALAIAALVLSLASLVWQAWTFLASGPRVKVTTANALPMYDGRGGDWMVTVEATNSGRAPCTVENWGIRLPGDARLITTERPAWIPPVPHRLEPHSSVTFYMAADGIRQIHLERGIPFRDMHPYATISGKGEVLSKDPVPLSD